MARKHSATVNKLLDEMSVWLDAHNNDPERCEKLFDVLFKKSRQVASNGNLFERLAVLIEMRASERGKTVAEAIRDIFDTDHPEMVHINFDRRHL